MRDRELTAHTKLAFGIGQVAESIQLNTFDFFLFFYYVQVLHLDPILAGTATLLALVVDAVTDPAVGVLSDNCRSRLGRRHPFMYASAIPFGLMFYLLFSPPAGIADAALFAWLAAFAIATRVSLTFFIVPYFAVGAELTENYRDRTSLVAYRTMFSFVSAIALSAVSFSVFFKATAEYSLGQLNPDAYPLFGITFAAVVVCAILASAAGTHRQIPFLHEVSREKGKSIRFAVLVRELTDLAKNRSFLAIFLMSITFFVVAGIQRALTLHVNTYFWALETDEIQTLFYVFFAVTLGTIPFVKRIIDRLDKKRTMYLGLGIIIPAFVLPTILRLVGWFPENESGLLLPLLLVDQSVAGVGMGILSVCSGSIVADVADDHELRSGQRQEGMLFGFLTLATKATSGAGQFLAGLALALIAFPTEQDVAPGDIEPNVLFDLGLVYGPLVALFGLLCIYVFSFYDISRTSHDATLKTLQQRRRARDSASVA